MISSTSAEGSRDASLSGPNPLAGGIPRPFTLGGKCGTAPTASGLILNLTVTQPTAAGFVTLYPGGTGVPATSTINFRAGVTRANSAIVRVGAGVAYVREPVPDPRDPVEVALAERVRAQFDPQGVFA